MSKLIVVNKDTLNKFVSENNHLVLNDASIIHLNLHKDDVQEFVKEANNLILKLKNGETIIIENFFIEYADKQVSDLVFEDDECGFLWFDWNGGAPLFKEITGLEALLPVASGSSSLLPWIIGGGAIIGGIIAGQNSDDDKHQQDKDTISPQAPTVILTIDSGSDNKDGITNKGDYTVSGIEDGATVEYSTDGGKTWSADKPVAQEGENSISVRQTDKAGNVSDSTEIKFTLDTKANAPSVTLTTDSGSDNKDGITNKGDYTVSGIEDGATVEYSTDGGKTWSADKPVAQEGENSIVVRQTDKAGNVSDSTDIKFTLDTILSTLKITVADSNLSVGESTTVIFTFSEAVTGFEVGDITAVGGNLTNLQKVNDSEWTATFTQTGTDTPKISVADDSYSDVAGNKGQGDSVDLNVLPVATAGTGTTEENTVLTANLPVATDIDGTIASYQLVTGPGLGNGSVTVNSDGTYSFNPGNDFDNLAVG
uniref:BapA/Bap/LapF family prefix-like domain-containing protein n=1 Tax=Acinetobacter baumannii TaxID=470 RepID=UPI0038921038